jgi:uncharacterized cupredoxin-like copper-binding protein
MRLLAGVAAVVAAVAVAQAATAGTVAQGGHSLQVQLGEWNIVPSQGLVAAGSLRVTVQNFGRLPHELDIIPTVGWGDRLRIVHGRAAGRDIAAPVVVTPGQTRSVRVHLRPGFYVLVDNIRGHYALGTEIPIIVG